MSEITTKPSCRLITRVTEPKPRDPKFIREEGATFVDCSHCEGTAIEPDSIYCDFPCTKCDGRGWFTRRDPAKVAAEKAAHEVQIVAFYAEQAAAKVAYDAEVATRNEFRQVTVGTTDGEGNDLDFGLDLWLDEEGKIQWAYTPYFPTRE